MLTTLTAVYNVQVVEYFQEVFCSGSWNVPDPPCEVGNRLRVKEPRTFLHHGVQDIDEPCDDEKDRWNIDKGLCQQRRTPGAIQGEEPIRGNEINVDRGDYGEDRSSEKCWTRAWLSGIDHHLRLVKEKFRF